MQELRKENQLLKGFVASLQKENQARNIEQATLVHEIDRLTAEIDRLNALKSNSRVIQTSGTSDKQMKTLKQTIASLTKEVQNLKNLNSKLTEDLRSRSNQVTILTQQQQRLLLQIKTLKESNTTNNKILLLESEVSNYKVKLSQITIIQEKLRVSNTRIVELETLNRRLESDYKRVEGDLRRQQTEVKRLENENKELILNKKSSIQMSSLVSSKLSLEGTIRQLNGKVQWLESNIKNAEQQKLSHQKRIRDLQRQLLEAKGKLTQSRFHEQSLKSLQASLSIKDKEMEALQQMIGSLKENKKYLEKLLREKQDIIINLEAQISHAKTTNSDHFQRQIDQLTANSRHLEKQLSLKIKSNQDLQGQLRLLRGQRQKMLRDINILTTSLDESHKQIKILKSKTTESVIVQHDPYFKQIPDRERNNDDLRMVVSSLKDQLEELKASQLFKPQATSTNAHHCQTCHHVHLKNHLQRQSRSPQKGHSKLIISNERDKSPFNKTKWENLQRKINALRSQNETLKRSLFE